MSNVVFAKFGERATKSNMEIIRSGHPFFISLKNGEFGPKVCYVKEAHILEGGQIVLETVEYGTLTIAIGQVIRVWEKNVGRSKLKLVL